MPGDVIPVQLEYRMTRNVTSIVSSVAARVSE
jgi:hypothetical protein